MANKQEQTPRDKRLLSLAAVGFLATAASLAFARVFVGPIPRWKLIAAALASAAVASLLERRSLALATLASAGLLFMAVGLLVFPQTTLWGLPTRETLHAIGDAIKHVGEQARVQVAPTPPLAPLMLAAVTAVWTATFSAHALAVRAGSPVLAALPPVALLAFADTVMEDGSRPIYATLFLSAALALIFVDGLRRVAQWGPVWSWPGRGRLSATTTRGARRVALLAVGIAALLPGILPGFGSGPLFDLSHATGDSVRIDPFVSIQAELTRRTPTDLFEVTAAQPDYWRMLALDEFDGTTWTTADLQLSNGQTLETPANLPSQFPPGAQELKQSFRVLTDVAFPWVPMAYPASSIDLPGGTVRYNEDLSAAVAPEGLSSGDRYSVTSALVVPTPSQLDRVRFGTPAQYGRYTYLPGGTPGRIYDIAHEWAAGATTPYRQILAIQNHLLQFTYSLDVKPRADSHALVDFLTRTQRGFCQQFASAMGALVRALGYPARVAVGFRPGTYDASSGTYRVSTDDAHSWVEVLFPGYGWLAFEPTPTKPNPVAQPYLAPAETAGCRPCNSGGATQNGVGGSLPPRLAKLERSVRRGGIGGAFPGAAPAPRTLHVPYGLLARLLAAVAVALTVLFPAAKWLLRGLRLRREREPRAVVLATYRVFTGRAADLGLPRRDGETMVEYRARLAAEVEFSDGHLERLTGIAARAAYSPGPVSGGEAREAALAARTAIRDMRRDRGVLRTIAGIYRPGV